MDKLIITRRRTGGFNGQVIDMAEAVEMATRSDNAGYEGVVEGLAARFEKQNQLITRMLNERFGMFEGDYSGSEYHPKTERDCLSYILGSDVQVTDRD